MNAVLKNFLFAFAMLLQSMVGFGQINPGTREYKSSINTREILEKVSLQHSVDGFEVSCDKQSILVWGKPKTIDASNPQKSRLTLVDAGNGRGSLNLELTGGIFGARYVKGGGLAIIEANWDMLLDLKSGKVKQIEANIDLQSLYAFEACGDFSGKSYLKYAK